MAFGVPDWRMLGLITRGIDNTATVPSDTMLKLAWQTGERTQILQLEPPAVNSSYDISFFGPTVRCASPTVAQHEAIEFYAGKIHNESGLYIATDTQDIGASGSLDVLEVVYSAFSPRLSELIDDPSVDATYNNWKPELGGFSPTNSVRPRVLQHALLQELWIELADQNIVCQLTNASYDIHVEYVNGAQTVSANSIETLQQYNETYLANSDADCASWSNEAYCSNLELSPAQLNYIGWFGALAYLINGNITLDVYLSALGAYNVTTKIL